MGHLTEGKLSGSFVLFIGLMLVGASIAYTGIEYLIHESGAPTSAFLAVIAFGIAMIIAGALLAKRYL